MPCTVYVPTLPGPGYLVGRGGPATHARRPTHAVAVLRRSAAFFRSPATLPGGAVLGFGGSFGTSGGALLVIPARRSTALSRAQHC